MECDRLIFEEQIVGRVVRVAGVDVRSLKWRLMGRVTAFFSYGQYLLFLGLAKSPLNEFRHWLEKKAEWTHWPAGPWFFKMTNPSRWYAFLAVHADRLRTKGLLQKLARKGITLQEGTVSDKGLMTEVWNEAFPKCRTTRDRLDRLFFHSRWFNPEGYFAVLRGADLLGWAYVRENSGKKGAGIIEVFALTETARQEGLEPVLFEEILEWFQKRRFGRILLSPHPAPASAFGIQLTSLMKTSALYGFEPTEVMIEMRCSRENYHRPENKSVLENLSIQAWQQTEDAHIRNFLLRNPRVDTQYDEQGETGADGVLLAKLGKMVVGLCRFITPEAMKDYGQTTWVWSLADPGLHRGYFLGLWVDKNFEGLGIRTTLSDRAFELLFAAGCQEISLMIRQTDSRLERFYQRLGFKTEICYFGSQWIDKN